MYFTLYVDRLINPGEEPCEGVRIGVADGVITNVQRGTTPSRGDIQFRSSICSPALVNAHDHLKYTWPEHIGEGKYQDSYEWLPTLYKQAEDRFLNSVQVRDLYWLGAYKAILSGVCTVANHCRPLPAPFFNGFGIRILHDFRREIFVREDSRAHQMGLGAAYESQMAQQEGVPFVVHIAEGLNRMTAEEVDLLERMGGLFSGAVLVHAINIGEAQINEIAACEASVVWCPMSNYFLFNQTTPVRTLLQADVNVCLGTDSTCTGAQDILHEMRYASSKLQFAEIASARLLFLLTTLNSCKAFGLASRLGKISPGYLADLLVFESLGEDPHVELLHLNPARMMLLMRDGKFLLRQGKVRVPCYSGILQRSRIDICGEEFEIVGSPNAVLERVVHATGYKRSDFHLGQIISANETPVFA